MFEIIIQIILIIIGAFGGYGFGKAVNAKPEERISIFNVVRVKRPQLLHISVAMWFISAVFFMML